MTLASLLIRAARLAETVGWRRAGEDLRRAGRRITRTAPAPVRGEIFAGSVVSAAAALAVTLGLDAAR